MGDTPRRTPTILLVTEDLLGAWLSDGLCAAGYRVQMMLPEDAAGSHWPQDTIALILGELRYPVSDHLRQLLWLRSAWASPPPLLLIGARPPRDQWPHDPGIAWMPAPIHRNAVIDLVSTMLHHSLNSQDEKE